MNADNSDFEPQEWKDICYTMQRHSPDWWMSFKEHEHRAFLIRCWQAEYYGGKLTADEYKTLTNMKRSGLWHALNNREPFIEYRERRQHPQRSNYQLN